MTITQGGNTYSTTTYNANGQSVESIFPGFNARVESLFDPAGNELGHYNGQGNYWWDRDVWLGGRMVAQLHPGVTYFLHANLLGSTAVLTDHAGTVQEDLLYYPLGQVWNVAGTILEERFAGMGNIQGDLFPTPARMYARLVGRWLSPDPLGGDVFNPQSLNRYAYVLNNPCSLTDPLGLEPCSFNIAINNSGLINPSQLNTLEGTLEGIFKTAGVGVNFGFSGAADYSLDVTASAAGGTYSVPGLIEFPPPNPNAVGRTPGFENYIANYGFAFVDRLMVSGYNTPTGLAVALGEVGAHEAGHYLLHIGDSPQNFGIMSESLNSPYFYPAFTGGQANLLQGKCKELHPPRNSPVPGGGNVTGTVTGYIPPDFARTCPEGYRVSSDGNQCVRPGGLE